MRALFLFLSLLLASPATGCSSPADAGTYTFVRARQTFGGFAPSDIAGLELWLDGSNAGSLTITSAPDVDQWNDLSGLGNHVSQGTAAKKPHTTTLNSLGALLFDGTDDILKNLTAGGTLTGNTGHVFFVVEMGTLKDFMAPIATSDTPTAAHYWHPFAYLTAALPNPFSGTLEFASEELRGGTTILTGTKYLYHVYSNGSTTGIDLDGVAETITVVSGSNTGRWVGDITLRDNLTVGARLIGGSEFTHFAGKMGEMLYYNTTITAGEVTSVTGYLTAKWF